MFACALAGAANVVGAALGKHLAAEELLGQYVIIIWAATLFVGGAAAMIGVFYRDRLTGLLMERMALRAIGIACLAYGGLLTVASAATLMGGTLTVSIGIAAIWRAVHVRRELNVLKMFMDRTMR